MIDFTEYDMDKIKGIDRLLFFDAERMNEIEWFDNQPFWRQLLSLPKKMPDKFKIKKQLEKL